MLFEEQRLFGIDHLKALVGERVSQESDEGLFSDFA
jgi:hypothetical protein